MKFEQVNYLMDVIMPTLGNANAFAIVSLIARKTWGMNDTEWVELSYSDFSEATGIKSTNTIKRAIETAEIFIEQRPKDTQGFVYRMKTVSNFDIVEGETVSDIDTAENETVSKNDTEPYQNLTPSISKNDTVSGGIKEKENKTTTDCDSGFADAVNAYENNIGIIYPAVSESIKVAVKELPDGWVIDAIKIAAHAGHRNWRYINGILRNWSQQGYQDNKHISGGQNGTVNRAARAATDEIGGYNV